MHFISWDQWEVCTLHMSLQVLGRPAGYHQDTCSLQHKYGHAAVLELAATSGFQGEISGLQSCFGSLAAHKHKMLSPAWYKHFTSASSQLESCSTHFREGPVVQRGGGAHQVTAPGREHRGWTCKAQARKPAPEQAPQ